MPTTEPPRATVSIAATGCPWLCEVVDGPIADRRRSGRSRPVRRPRRPSASCTVLCPLTGRDHQLFWMRSAWWCHDCRQKIESCCEGGGCPSIAEVAIPARGDGVSFAGRDTSARTRTT